MMGLLKNNYKTIKVSGKVWNLLRENKKQKENGNYETFSEVVSRLLNYKEEIFFVKDGIFTYEIKHNEKETKILQVMKSKKIYNPSQIDFNKGKKEDEIKKKLKGVN